MEFSTRDLERFAEWSGDRNPLHLDSTFAGRTSFGRPITHGMLTVIEALRSVSKESYQSFKSLEIEFHGAVYPNESYQVKSAFEKKQLSVEVLGGVKPALIIRADFGKENSSQQDRDLSWVSDLKLGQDLAAGQSRKFPANRKFEEFRNKFELVGVYSTEPPPDDYITQGHLSPIVIKVFGFCSYLVGMEVPGLRSLFTRLRLQFHETTVASKDLVYRVNTSRFDREFRILDTELEIATPDGILVATGDVRSYIPFSPTVTDLAELGSRLELGNRQHEGKVALVCGGSRGLGADLASALALSGYHVYASYRNSREDAEELADRITKQGAHLELLQGDVGDPNWCSAAKKTILERHGRLDLLILNACSPPGSLRISSDSAEKFEEYIFRNLRLVQLPLAEFLPTLNSHQGSVVAISSSAVENPPADWGHYVALKQAMEGIIQSASREFANLFCLIVRPPKLQTAWNDSPTHVIGAIPTDLIAVHTANRLAKNITRGQVEVLSNFPVLDLPTLTTSEDKKADFNIVLSASFTAEPFLPALRFWFYELGLPASVEISPYGQVLQELINPGSALSSNSSGISVVMLRIRDWLRELSHDAMKTSEGLRTFLGNTSEEFVRAMRSHRAHASVDTIFVLCPSINNTLKEEDRELLNAESNLLQELTTIPGLQIIAAKDFNDRYDVNPDEINDPLREEIAHIPYKDAYIYTLATLLMRSIYRKFLPVRKVVVVDCDNTLWAGVVGELGVEGIKFDLVHKELHATLTRLGKSGMLICLCSKNEEVDVWEVFESRKDFGLRRDQIVASMINWNPKSENIRLLASRLNVGIDSFIFIDDNPVECAEVRSGCPEVLVLEWPQEDNAATRLLQHTWEFDLLEGTKEDSKRTKLYRDEFRRQEAKDDTFTLREFIESLQLQVDIIPLSKEDVPRASQLTLRTNQFNFTTRRRKENDLKSLFESDSYVGSTIQVRDRFGDYGLVGLVIAEKQGAFLLVDTFLLSCRVLGRGVEHEMAAELGRRAMELKRETVRFLIIPTEKNTPARSFLESICSSEQKKVFEGSFQCDIPAAELSNLKFEPAEQKEDDSQKQQKEKQSTPDKVQVIDGKQQRSRERQIVRAASELSSIKQLNTAIGGSTDNQSLSPLVAHSDEQSDDIAQQIYQTFSAALNIPISNLKEIDQLEQLGCSSFKIVEITVSLTDKYSWLPSTLLFEHRSISEIIQNVTDLLGKTDEREPASTSEKTITTVADPGNKNSQSDIAVIGMNLRCGGANSPDELWELLSSGGTSVGPAPPDRGYPDNVQNWAAWVDGVDSFDANFFGISPREAEYMDPQLRLFLETAWSALEDGACMGDRSDVDTGVYVGVLYGDYVFHANCLAGKKDQPYRCWEGFSLANRLSQFLGFRGPSLAVNTACSSSGTALHIACKALAAGECTTAIVGGVNLILDADRLSQLGRLGIISPTGKCSPFGNEANGTIIGEGVGVVVLRPLHEAQQRGDHIYGVIKGTALSTGAGTVGFTAPNPTAQAEAIRKSLIVANVDPRTITMVEAHGTGTALGDPIEVRGLTLAYTDKKLWDKKIDGTHTCKLSAIKPNIGHLEAGAGIMGLIKVLLQFDRGYLLPTITSEQPNSQIPFETLPFKIQRKLEPWDRAIMKVAGVPTTFPRRAGLSSFGVGGANAHLILEEPPEASSSDNKLFVRPFHILTLSARNKESLDNQVLRVQEFLGSNQDLALEDISYTANIGRKHFEHRLAFLGSNQTKLMGSLEDYVAGEDPIGCVQGRSPKSTGPTKIAFLFTGQGAQYLDMGKALYKTHPVFRETLDQCVENLKPCMNCSILDVMFAEKESSEALLLNQTGYTQPALFVIEYSLAKLWESWGIHPDIVIGHSVGEIAALCVAGGVSLEDGLKLTAARGQLMQALPSGGGMASVRAGEAEVKKAILGYEDRVSIAGFNSPEQTVISGDGDAINEILAQLEVNGIKTKALSVSHAFHSHLMDPMIDKFKEVVKEINFSLPKIPFVSCVKGTLVTDEIKDSEYWVQQVRNPVRFTEGMKRLEEQSVTTFLEVGPQPVLLGMGKHCLPDEEVDWLPSLRGGADEWQTVLGSLAKLYVRGVSIDWKGFDAPYSYKIVSIPNYSFRRKQFWIDIPSEQTLGINKALPARSALDELLSSQDESGFSDYVRNAIKLSTEEAMVLPKVFKALSLEAEREQDEVQIGEKLYQVVWKEKLQGITENSKKAGGIWIILMDQNGFGEILTKVLANNGTEYTCVWRDTHFKQKDADNFFIDPQQAEHFEKLWQSIYAQDKPINGVIQLWALDTPLSSELNAEDFDSYQKNTTESALHLVQTLAKRSEANKPAIWLITRDAVKTGEDVSNEVVSVAQTPLWGFARTISLEHHDLWGGILDLSSNGDLTDQAEMLYTALSNTSTEDQLALRGGKPFVPRLIKHNGKRVSDVVLDDKGSYLITGGLGALGLHTAGWLIKKGAKNLILTSRRGMESPDAKEIVVRLEKQGANVKVIAADICCTEDVDKLFTEIKNSKLFLRGIVHAAGVDALVPVAEMSVHELRDLLAPKMKGAWLLHKHTLDVDLDMFICFSSISSIWGSSGRAHYGAANAFLDGLAYYRQSLELPALSVNWGPWKGGGMANEEQLQLLERMGNHGLDPDVAVLALEYLLHNADAQGIVADIDWAQFRSVFEARKARPLFSELEGIPRGDTSDLVNECPRWITLLREKSTDQHSELLTKLLQKEVAKTLGFENPEEVRLDQGLFDIGMDSLMAIELATQLNKCLGIRISATDFSQPNLRILSEHFLNQLNLDVALSPGGKSKGEGCVSRTEVKGNGLQSKWMEQIKEAPSEERAIILVELLRKEVAKTLGLEDPEEVRLDRSLFEIGMDSLMAVELANGLKKRFGIQISASDFSLPHLEAIAAHLLGQLPVAKEHQTGVIHFSPDLESETFEYHRKAFPGRRTDWVEPRWRWMFLESAKRLNIDPMIWLYRDSDSIVSHCGAIPVKIKIGERECSTSWFAESMTLESHRSKGVGGMILMQSKEDVPFNLSLGQEEFMRNMQIKLGWTLIGPLGVYFYPLRPQNILQGKLPKGPVSWGASAALSLTTEMKRVIGRPSHKWKPEICSINRFDGEHDELWKSVSKELTCTVVRDASFLNWKYVDQPGQNFKKLEIRKEGEVLALAIISIEEPSDAYPYRRAFLVDLIVKPSDSEAVWAVLDAVRAHSIHEEADAIICYLSCPALKNQLVSFGFRSREATRFLIASTEGVEESEVELLSSMDNWYLTMGDSDIDRPW